MQRHRQTLLQLPEMDMWRYQVSNALVISGRPVTDYTFFTLHSEDCADGTCYEGWCSGDQAYSTDGTCGKAHGYRLCAGIQGSCCNFDGKCGNGTNYCATGVCQSGKCENLQKLAKLSIRDATLPWLTGTTPDGTCGGLQGYTCDVFVGGCCNKHGRCGSRDEDFWRMSTAPIYGCGTNGGQMGVTPDLSNPLYNTPEYKKSGAKPEGIVVKIVKAPKSS
ncbi:hypothetical protein A9K55_008733 [Cordyceps militaris]|uniref:Chitin-binding type-1 domain-containing protein n=1 Tax=Cordyceps militaris TaxID=73501 RepID=A0A2H4SEK8_CORMI|nr:hypothetical protein A9K55_008733 [Cordyceps militaris]